MAANFSSVPVLDFALANDEAHMHSSTLAFSTLKNHTVPQNVIDDLIGYIPRLFDLPQEAKNEILMANSPHFFGYSKLGTEVTKGKIDYSEIFSFGTPHETRWRPGAPEYLRLWGPCQWPDERLIPGFRNAMETYLAHVQELSYRFISLLAEALGLPSETFDTFYDKDEPMQHRGKVVKYPANDGSLTDQGVGPHYDSGFLTFLLQASPHPGLQVQNLSGEWIDAPPIPGTFVVNFGKGNPRIRDAWSRTRHLSPGAFSPHRLYAPLLRTILPKHQPGRTSLRPMIRSQRTHTHTVPADILKLKALRGDPAATDSVNFTEFDREPSGKVVLIGRIKSHPDIAERHYPDLFKQYFPSGLPKQLSEY
ncbi:Clavaminate synthase-like protein [Boletus coccyginus]|nr:Clavaminate synthase-like protein [Boletus coccyginus]